MEGPTDGADDRRLTEPDSVEKDDPIESNRELFELARTVLGEDDTRPDLARTVEAEYEVASGAPRGNAVTPEDPHRYRPRGGSRDRAEIGRGGLGRVLVAFDVHVGREVAIKELLRSDRSTDRARLGLVRFLREARITGQLEHPNIVPVYEVGQRADGSLYYAMRMVRGKTLAHRLADCRSSEERLALLGHYLNVCNAIAYAHSRGVIHRDLKPENVMIGEFGETVVLDWGLAKVKGIRETESTDLARELELVEREGMDRTADGSMLGTPAYMSPEQAEGKIDELDERSDVWGLGAVLYEILTGRPPHQARSVAELIYKVVQVPVTAAREADPSAPPELSAIADKALRIDREERYPSAKELAADVGRYLQGARVTAHRYTSTELLRRFIAQNRALTLGVSAVAITLVAASLVIALAYAREQRARAAAEVQRKLAETERASAQQKELEAKRNLSIAYVGKAEQLLRENDFNGSFLHAATALRESQRPGLVLAEPDRVALDSVLYESSIRRTVSLERTLTIEGGRPELIALSPDGSRVALHHLGGQMTMRRTDGSASSASTVGGSSAEWMRFTPDGKAVLVWGWDCVLRTLSADDLHELESESLCTGGGARLARLETSRDQALVVGIDEHDTLQWMDRRGDRRFRSIGKKGNAASVAFAADGKELVVGTPASTLITLELGSGRETRSIALGTVYPALVLPASKGPRVLVAHPGATVVVDLDRGTLSSAYEEQFTTVTAASSSSSWILAGPKRVISWDGHDLRPREVIASDAGPYDVADSSDGRTIACMHGVEVDIWRARTRYAREIHAEGDPTDTSWFPDGKRIAIGTDRGVAQILDVESGEAIETFSPTKVGPTGVALSPNQKQLATVGPDYVVHLRDLATKSEIVSKPLSRSTYVWSLRLAWSADGATLFATGPDGGTRALNGDLSVGRMLHVHGIDMYTLRTTPGRDFLYTADWQGIVTEYRASDHSFSRSFDSEHRIGVRDLAVAEDRSVYTAGREGIWKRFSPKSEPLLVQSGHSAQISAIALSPAGNVLVTGSEDRSAKTWNATTGALLRVLHPGGAVLTGAFSPKGGLLAIGGTNRLVIFPDVETTLPGNGEELLALAMRETGRRIERDLKSASVSPIVVAKKPDPEELQITLEHGLSDGTNVIGTKTGSIELLSDPEEASFSPPLKGEVDSSGRLSIRLPKGLERFVIRVTTGAEQTYAHFPMEGFGTTRGKHIVIKPESASDLATVSIPLGVKIDPTKGVVQGFVVWAPRADFDARQSVGCAVASAGGERVYYAIPGNNYPTPSLTESHWSMGAFYVFNAEPGMRTFSASIAGHRVDRAVQIHAGAVTTFELVFDETMFAANPTPAHCLEDWAPAR